MNIDFPKWMILKLDHSAQKLGVLRQSLIKVWLNDSNQQPKGVYGISQSDFNIVHFDEPHELGDAYILCFDDPQSVFFASRSFNPSLMAKVS